MTIYEVAELTRIPEAFTANVRIRTISLQREWPDAGRPNFPEELRLRESGYDRRKLPKLPILALACCDSATSAGLRMTSDNFGKKSSNSRMSGLDPF